ncbi:MAG TPA: transporter substrate-binding domain-containing protein [Hyphomicrobiaceae bacterium]|nr:transporter substrate-binding domain-containing protein [Hyphomicrobiaceae bacterium]
MSRRLTAWILGLACLLGGVDAARAQALPYHADPSARDLVPNLTAVPSIRFLTTADFPPFNYRDATGELVGFNVDVARALCADLEITCTIQAWPWDQASSALADGQGDALIAGLAMTPENGKRFDFSSIYLMLPGRFVAKDTGIAGFSPTQLAGKAVAVRKGSSHETFVTRYVPDAKPVEFDTEFLALEAVRDGKADAYFGDAMRASFWLNDNPDCCGFAGPPYFRPDLFGDGLSVALPAGHDAVRQAIDYGLIRLKRSGVLDELYLRWFPIGFY